MFAIKTCRISDEITVGHLQREISRSTKYLIDRRAKVTAKLSTTKYRKSPLFQGSLEIPCIVTISLPARHQRPHANSAVSEHSGRIVNQKKKL